MGDSSCLMHGFSYASAIPNEAKQGNPMHALGESISFGRFMSESLDWEKWSAFSRKKYVEEAERYSKPGSVAQKKAFFEAHYKNIAAQKAAALLEQETPKVENTKNSSPDSDLVVKAHVHENLDALTTDSEGVFDVVEKENEVPVVGPSTPEVMEKEPSNLDNGEAVSGSEISETSHTEKPLLKVKQNSSSRQDDDAASVTSKKKSAFASIRSSVYSKRSKVSFLPARHNVPVHVDKENNFTPITQKFTFDQKNEMKPTPNSFSKSINFPAAKESYKVPPPPPPLKKDSSMVASTTLMAAKNCASKLINFPAAKEPYKVPPPPPPLKKDSSMVASTTLMAAKNCATPLKTPMTSNRPVTTPSSESRRIRTPMHPAVSGSKTAGPKWNILSSVSKSFTACRNKLQSPTLSSSPFILKTEERAALRKQKLEEKFNAKEVKKVQPQTTFKEKAEGELRKLRQSFCFKARPLPEFYKERETTARDFTKQSQLPKFGRKPFPSSMQQGVSSASLPKTDSFKNSRKKTS